MNKKVLATISALLVCFALLYRDVIAKLVHDWYVDDNYSHGFLIVPIALYFAWERRGKLREAVARPSPWGLVLVLGAWRCSWPASSAPSSFSPGSP